MVYLPYLGGSRFSAGEPVDRRSCAAKEPCHAPLVSARAIASHWSPGRASRGAQDKRPMTFVDILELPTIQDPQLSPDGKQILFVMDKADWKGNRRIGHIYRINADGTDQVQLTFGERGESSPRWSPDGKHDRVHRPPRRRHQQPDLPARHRAAAKRAALTNHPTAHRQRHLGARRQVDLTSRATDAKSAEEKRQGPRPGRRVRVRGDELQAAASVDDRPRGQDEEAHRRRRSR